MTRLAISFFLSLMLVLAACAPTALPSDALTTTPLIAFNETQEALLALTNTASAEFALSPVPTSTPTMPPTIASSIEPPTLTPTIIVTEDTRIPVTLNPSVITDLEAPIRIDIPQGWRYGSDAMLVPGSEGVTLIPFSIYQGEVTGGQGTIIVLWAFENIIPAAPSGTALSGFNLFADGLRLLLFVVIEPECQFGYNDERSFTVGGIEGRGTFFIAQECPEELPSLQGWFSAFRLNKLNFAFYAYTEPHDALVGPARDELQAILDTVVFDFSLLPTPAPTDPPVVLLTVTPSVTPDVPNSTPAP